MLKLILVSVVVAATIMATQPSAVLSDSAGGAKVLRYLRAAYP